MSTGAIFSLNGCNADLDSKNLFKKDKTRPLIIGTQTDLMSIDPLSVNSLEETFIKSLLYKQVFYIENNKFKSDYFKIDYADHTLKVISKKNDSIKISDVEEVYHKLQKSALWGSSFKDVLFDKKQGFVCKVKKNCISKMTSIIKHIRLKKNGTFKVVQFVKGQTLLLQNKVTKNLIYFVKIKSIEDGEKLLKANKIDIVLPSDDVTSDRKIDLRYFHHNNKVLRLTLYKKYKNPVDKQFYAALCESKKIIDKAFKSWRSKHNICNDKRNITFKNQNKTVAISTSKNLIKIFDIIKPKTTNNLIYEMKSSIDLVNSLKDGSYDLYLSQEIFDNRYPVLYSAFHSAGAYNSLEIKDRKLDAILDKASKAKTLKKFNAFSNMAKIRINRIEPILFRFEKPFIEFIIRKKQNKVSLKPTLYKTLVGF